MSTFNKAFIQWIIILAVGLLFKGFDDSFPMNFYLLAACLFRIIEIDIKNND